MTRLYAIDMGSVFSWQYFANEGIENGALKGIEHWFGKFREQLQPTHIVACLDGGSDRRKAIDPEYKLNRKAKPKPEDYLEQLRWMPGTLAKLGIMTMMMGGEEADDCLASVVARHADPACEVIVCSSDKDLSALVSEHCQLYDPKPNAAGECRFWDTAGVIERMGVPPWRVADLLAMMGDSSDGIKGIKGIGKDRALCALRQTKSMAELFRKAAAGKLADLGPATQKRIAEGKPEYEHALKLVQLRTDIPTLELKDFELRGARAA